MRQRRTRPGAADPMNVDAIKLRRLLEYVNSADLLSATKQMAGEIFEKYTRGRSCAGVTTANLYYDSRAVPAPAGVRPSLLSERRMKFLARRTIIELSITPVFPGRFELTGRVDNSEERRPVAVRLTGGRQLRAETDEFGFFSFSALNPGKYSLSFTLGGEDILLDELELE